MYKLLIVILILTSVFAFDSSKMETINKARKFFQSQTCASLTCVAGEGTACKSTSDATDVCSSGYCNLTSIDLGPPSAITGTCASFPSSCTERKDCAVTIFTSTFNFHTCKASKCVPVSYYKCSADIDCYEDAKCINGDCTDSYLAKGADCGSSVTGECVRSTYCDATSKCVDKAKDGDDCTTVPCNDFVGLGCDISQTPPKCVPYKTLADGTTAVNAFLCNSIYIKNGTCAPAPTAPNAGKVCTSDDDCAYSDGGIQSGSCLCYNGKKTCSYQNPANDLVYYDCLKKNSCYDRLDLCTACHDSDAAYCKDFEKQVNALSGFSCGVSSDISKSLISGEITYRCDASSLIASLSLVILSLFALFN